jgi:hypothetical protein
MLRAKLDKEKVSVTHTVTEASWVVDGMCLMFADNSPDKCSQSSSTSEYRRHFYVCDKLPQPTLFPLIKSHLSIDKSLSSLNSSCVCGNPSYPLVSSSCFFSFTDGVRMSLNPHPSSVVDGVAGQNLPSVIRSGRYRKMV